MNLTTMYSAKNNSPVTILTASLNSSGTSMSVADSSVFPAAPNIAVIGSSDNAEIVLYTKIINNTLTIVRGQHGTTPGTWSVGTSVARNFTAYDHDAFVENINELNLNKTDVTVAADIFDTSKSYSIDDLVMYNGALYRFKSVHLAGAWNSDHVTPCTVADVLRTFGSFEIIGSVSSVVNSVTFSDSRINSEHWRVPKHGVRFGTPSNIIGDIDWTTDIANHTITIRATFIGPTTVEIDMIWCQDIRS